MIVFLTEQFFFWQFYLIIAKLVKVLVKYLKRLNLYFLELDVEMLLLFSNQNVLTVLNIKEAILALFSLVSSMLV